jgi:hypothetical protein
LPLPLRLRLSTRLRHRLGKVREQHREPKPKRHLYVEPHTGRTLREIANQQRGAQRGAGFHDKDHRILQHLRRIQLHERIANRAPQNLPVEHRPFL